jgi:regulation of enolase protein 1 (concanavalin A-like superfamily)
MWGFCRRRPMARSSSWCNSSRSRQPGVPPTRAPGGRIAAAFSSDGKSWKNFRPIKAPRAGEEVLVGVVAVNTSTGPHEVFFDDYSLTGK